MSWLLLSFGLISALIFARQLISGMKSGVAQGTGFDVNRLENPIVFWMAIFLNSMFVLMGIWFVLEGFRRLSL